MQPADFPEAWFKQTKAKIKQPEAPTASSVRTLSLAIVSEHFDQAVVAVKVWD